MNCADYIASSKCPNVAFAAANDSIQCAYAPQSLCGTTNKNAAMQLPKPLTLPGNAFATVGGVKSNKTEADSLSNGKAEAAMMPARINDTIGSATFHPN